MPSLPHSNIGVKRGVVRWGGILRKVDITISAHTEGAAESFFVVVGDTDYTYFIPICFSG